MGWLGVVAVVSNLLASVLCMIPAQSAGAIDDLLGPHAMCIAGESQAPDNSAPPPAGGSPDSRDGKSGHCKACTLLAGAALLVAFVFALIAFPVRIVRPFSAVARTLADHLSLGGIRSRAPPLPA
jgi:hypothetical protein